MEAEFTDKNNKLNEPVIDKSEVNHEEGIVMINYQINNANFLYF